VERGQSFRFSKGAVPENRRTKQRQIHNNTTTEPYLKLSSHVHWCSQSTYHLWTCYKRRNRMIQWSPSHANFRHCTNTPADAWTPLQGHHMQRFLSCPRSSLVPQHLGRHLFPHLQTGPQIKKNTILQKLDAAFKLYQCCSCHVCNIHADHEFECVHEDLLPIEINIVPAVSHVGKVEHSIHTIMECLCLCVQGLPFQCVPKLFAFNTW